MTKRATFGGILLIGGLAVLICLLANPETATMQAQDPAAENGPEPAPPAGQTYIGSKNCSSCHFEQFLVWRQDKHSKAFDNLPAKYKTDASCLKCHTTGFGEPTGFKTAADTHLASISCEVCHGPGSQHQEICKAFGKAKPTAAQEKMARDSIYKVKPQNICIQCHTSKGHKAHPKYDK